MKNILLLHGALGASEDLNILKQELEKHSLNVFSFSFSGHGKKGFENKFGIQQFAQELTSFIHENKLEEISVFGYSMGGYVALYLASQQDYSIKSVITLGTKFNWSKESVEKETKMLVPEVIVEKVPAFAKAMETKHGEHWKELMQKTADLMHEINAKEFLNPEILKALNIPVLIGLGDKDQMVSLEETTTVFKTISKASMYMLPGTKHPLESVDTDYLARIIADFIIRN